MSEGISPEEDFFNEYFRLTTDEDKGQWMTATAILLHIKHAAGSAVRGDNVRNFGRFLSNIPEILSRHSQLEYLVEIDAEAETDAKAAEVGVVLEALVVVDLRLDGDTAVEEVSIAQLE